MYKEADVDVIPVHLPYLGAIDFCINVTTILHTILLVLGLINR